MVDEHYELTSSTSASPVVREYTFEMRPWTTDELDDRLVQAGYHSVAITSGVGRRTQDRFLVVLDDDCRAPRSACSLMPMRVR